MHPLAVLIGGFLSGVLLRSFFDVSFFELGLLALFAASFLFYGALYRRRAMILSALLLIAICAGVVRFHIADVLPSAALLSHVGERTTFVGVVSAEPDLRETSLRLVVTAEKLNGVPIEPARVLVVTDRSSLLEYGDVVEVEGKLERPEAFETDSGRTFDYEAYLGKDDIFFSVSFAMVSVIQETPWSIRGALFSLKGAWQRRLNALVGDPHAALLAGMIVGAKQSLGKELLDLFRITGLIHIVVLSGYNITVVAEAVRRVFSRMPKPRLMRRRGVRPELVLSAIVIILFVLLVGASATVLRAGIMALIAVLALGLVRRYNVVRALIIAAFLMVVWNPKILAFDPSFQLSFIATLGLVFVTPIVEHWLKRVPDTAGMRTIIAATIGTQIAVLPLLLYMMGALSLVAIPVNVLVLATVPFAMFFGFFAGALGFVSNMLAFPFAAVAHMITEYQLFIVNVFGGLAFASISVPAFPWWIAVLGYALMSLLVWRWHRRERSMDEERGSVHIAETESDKVTEPRLDLRGGHGNAPPRRPVAEDDPPEHDSRQQALF